jgi:hypothetical protein
MKETGRRSDVGNPTGAGSSRALEVKTVTNPVLARLIDEVRYEKVEGPHAYNRQHNRHNR